MNDEGNRRDVTEGVEVAKLRKSEEEAITQETKEDGGEGEKHLSEALGDGSMGRRGWTGHGGAKGKEGAPACAWTCKNYHHDSSGS